MTNSSITLPYVVEDDERKKLFTQNMETAAMLCLAEAKRKKPHILGTSQEKLSFISKLHYPLWAIPWDNNSIIVDGLEIFSHAITYMKPPDVKLFVEDLQRSRTIRAFFRSILKKHAKTFEDFIDATQISIDAIVANKETLTTIQQYITQGLTYKKSATAPIAIIPPKLDEKLALERAEKLLDTWRLIQSEIKGLQYAINVLSEETKHHEQKIASEVEQIKETFEKKLSHIKSEVDKKIEKLTTERNAKTKRIFKASEKELKVALKEKERYEQKLEKLERDKRVYQKRKQIRKRKGDEAGVTYWEHKIKVCKNKISEVKGKLKVLSRFIENTRKQGELGIKKLNDSYQEMIVRERKKVSDIEALRDSQIKMTQKEIEELKSETSAITNLIEQLIEQKRLHASQLKNLTIPWKPEKVTLINVPFYVFRYETEKKSRYHMHPPVVAMGYEGIIRKIQKVIWSFSLESRIKLLLHPRSEALEKMFTSMFAEKIRKDKAFGEIVYKAGSSNNLLNTKDFREVLAKGMEELKVEGWISQEEKDAILKAYT
ncbi:hypothetical protein DRO69_03250 [Candidatus Bathyarchaeota archaeon]|nr:MAG: hypothetical protein DRO69_03250 [Candidatus Bathyarchaeota archaeon]